MAVYSVFFQINTRLRSYADFYREIRSLSHCCNSVDSNWLIASGEPVKQVARRLKRHLDHADYLLVIEVGGNYAGSLPAESWEWLKANIPAAGD